MSGTFLNNSESIFCQLSSYLLGGDNCIDVPKNYHSRARLIKNSILDEDRSGIVATVFDFMVDTGSVDFRISANNTNLQKALDDWKSDINSSMIHQIPSGMRALATQYYMERWSSSLIVLNITWKKDKKSGLVLPGKMWFSDGSKVHVEGDGRILGTYDYYLGAPKSKGAIKLPLPQTTFFVRKPNSSWYDKYPSPYLVKRGTAYHWKFKKMLVEKQFDVLKSIMMYMLLAKKGTENTFLEGTDVDDSDLEDLLKKIQGLKSDSKTKAGAKGLVGAFAFDTDFQHFMPELEKIFNEKIIAPTDRNILASLGLIEIIEGISTSRKDAILNPKPLVEEIKNGVIDFRDLMVDVLKIIREKNIEDHPKMFTNSEIKITPSTIKAFVTEAMRDQITDWYDRGIVGKSEGLESTTDLNFAVQVEDRIVEQESGLDVLMAPPAITHSETTSSNEVATAKAEVIATPERTYREVPYDNNSDLSKSVKKLPEEAQTMWRETFNKVFVENAELPKSQQEGKAIRIAWGRVRKSYKQHGDNWIKK